VTKYQRNAKREKEMEQKADRFLDILLRGKI
jgi:hypothetical protein